MYAIHLWWWSYRETRPEADGGPPRRAAPDAEFSASESRSFGVSEFRAFERTAAAPKSAPGCD